jgi:hypothetical protein
MKAQKAKEKQAMAEAAGKSKRTGKAIRPNYMSMTDTDFHRIRCKDFYADQERDESSIGALSICTFVRMSTGLSGIP